MIVVDASVVGNALIDDSAAGERARLAFEQDRDLHAPHLLDLEIANSLRKQRTIERLGLQGALRALTELRLLPVRRYPHTPLLPRIWELRDNASAYDASYVALAELLGCTLVTTDRRLARLPGARCPVEVLS